jgi:acetyl-CoA acetyltransferase
VRDVFIIGANMTRFGEHHERTLRELGRETCAGALRDAGIEANEIQAGFCGNALAPMIQGETGVGQGVLWEVGINKVPILNIENACASGSTAVHEAWKSIAGDHCDMAIVVGVEKSVMPKGTALNVGTTGLETQLGDIFPGAFALMAMRHMEEFGTTREQMAQISVKNHFNGTLNPNAQFQTEMTVDDVLASPMIADPLTLYSCCPNSDGAAALVLCDAKHARRYGEGAKRLAASVLTSGNYDNDRDITGWEAERTAAQLAYEIAGLGPRDIDCAEVHDAFSICEIVHYEGLGFCQPGEGGQLSADGTTALGGRLPVNPSGGLLAKGHPAGASGVAQIAELVWQLRGQAGKRQVEGARTALAQIMGGSQQGDVCACTVHILASS